MIKKTLRNAVAGTVAAGALLLPGATTVAPQLELMACNYPDSKDTNTEQELSEYAIRKGAVTSTVIVNNLDGGGTPNGTITVTLSGPGKDISKSRKISGQNSTARFTFGGFGKKKQGTYTLTAVFNGDCRYADSSDTDHLVVMR